MKFLTIFVVTTCINAIHSEEGQTPTRKANRRYSPKTDHDKELLKLVAEKINVLLKDADGTKRHDDASTDHGINTEARIFETLAHVIADVSEQMQKRSFTKKNLINSQVDMKLHGDVNVKKHADDGKIIESVKKLPDREAEKPVLRLTPRVVFMDAQGNEFHLVGTGGRATESCTGQCLRVDGVTKNILAYKKPGIGEHLVLSGRGEDFFTSGVQLCDDGGKKTRNSYSDTNLALLAPNKKLLVHWEDDKAAEVKRENPVVLKEFSNEVDTLFNGGGLKNSPVAKQTSGMSGKVKTMRRKKHARLHARRVKNPHRRTSRDVANDDYYYDDGDDESLVKSAPVRTTLELKLLEDLKKDKKNLEHFQVKQNSQLETCKKRCEVLTNPTTRHKRSADNLDSEGDIRPMKFRKIAIEPKNEHGLIGEINMVQPESSPEDENRVVLKATGKPINPQHEKIVEKFDADDEDVPDLVPVTDSDELVYFPEDDDLGNVGDNVVEPPEYFVPELTTPKLEPVEYEDDGLEKAMKPSSAEVGSQFAEAILYRVQNSEHLKKALGFGLRYHPPTVVDDPVPQHSPHYASTLQLLLRTLMLNVEKIAEEDVAQRSCITLETDLQDFLDEMINLKSHPNMPNQYTANAAPSASYSTLALRKNELLDLLHEYQNLPLTAQQHASGVKSFIETEVNEIDKQINQNQPKRQQRFIQNTFNSRN